MKILHLTLKKKWFDMIASGEKKEEYRDEKEYWQQRLMNFDICSRNSFSSFKKPVGFKHFDVVEFKNGYSKNAPSVTVECLGIEISTGKEEWGAKNNVDYFVIKLGKIIEKKI